MIPEALQVLLTVVDALEDLRVPYHLGGSFASSVHGNPRQTRDLDLVVDLNAEAVSAFALRLETDFYLDPDRIREAVRRRSSVNLIHLATGFKIDIFIRGTEPFDRAEFERHGPTRLVEDPPRDVMVKSAEDTILRKLQWYRLGGEASDRQWLDVLGVIRVQGERLDREYLDHWSSVLGIDDLLGRAMKDQARG